MLEHLKSFADVDSYKEHIFSSNAVFPNVSYVRETDKVYYNPHRDIQAGEIIYLNGGKLYATKLPNWNSSLGTAQGVVVVPASHTTDDTVRIISLVPMSCDTPDAGGSAEQGIYWGGDGVDLTGLTNYDLVPTTSNNDSTTIGTHSYSRLPSNNTNGNFTGATCVTDIETKYYNPSQPMCPSPYLRDNTQNPAYIGNTNGRIATSDFDGRRNTDIICASATGQSDWQTASVITNSDSSGYYPAACCCRRYGTSGLPSGNWYLPACGELGYINPRFKQIQDSLQGIIDSGQVAVLLPTSNDHWSSTEYSRNNVRTMNTYSGRVDANSKNSSTYVRAFASVPLSSLSF